MKDIPLTLTVLAAGMGSRYGGLKQMDPLGPAGETILDYSVFDAARAGFSRVVFVIRKDFEAAFRERAKRFEKIIAVDFAFQDMTDLPHGFAVPAGREKPWGTAHAVRAAREAINGPFAVINADDFYGADAYRQLAGFLKGTPAHRGLCPVGLVAFRLDKTLSPHGGVARGVCTTDARGKLVSIEECVGLVSDAQGGAKLLKDGADTGRRFAGNTPVSMNCWGFSADFLPILETEFLEFMRAKGTELKSESYLPAAVDAAVAKQLAQVEVLRTDGDWFGVTYREDAPAVRAALKALTARGDYPSPLLA